MSKVKTPQYLLFCLISQLMRIEAYLGFKSFVLQHLLPTTKCRISHTNGPNSTSGRFLRNLSLYSLRLNYLQSVPAKGRPVTTMDFKSSCKICQPICLVKIDNFDLYLRWVYSNEKHNFSYINKNDERIKILKEQLKTLLKLLCPHPGFAVNIFYSYNFFLDNWVSFWNGLAYLLSVCGIDLEDK